MVRIVIALMALLGWLHAGEERPLEKQIGRMIVMGFDTLHVDANSSIVQALQRYDLGGVIVFDRFYDDRNRSKNIRDPQQLQRLTQQLQRFSPKPLLIAVDQEGGRVERLKARDGFKESPSAQACGAMTPEAAKKEFDTLARQLQAMGINTNFAPVVDLAVNPDNRVIFGLQRSFGAAPLHVSRYASLFMDAMREAKVLSVLKHFPGHGSSLGDSHQGFVDVTKTWRDTELEPYRHLIAQGRVDMIMTAHVFNAALDPRYPATLSRKINTDLLRQELGFEGVIISDDLQMKAISEHYSLKETVTLAINSGVDMLLFGEQLAHHDLDALINTIASQVRSGAIAKERIQEANRRIEALHVSRKIIDRPILFGSKRVALTKEYIKAHYGKTVDSITIDPKMIVLHWTAIMDADASYERLRAETLYSDRKDISAAGALNVSAHFLVDRDGTIYRLMPENIMARHVIGLNYCSIGIENVGGENNEKQDLTPEQVAANIDLVRYLGSRYKNIAYLIGHHEYRRFEGSALWLERDAGYRTIKNDPGERFMNAVRHGVSDLKLKQH